MPSGRRRGPASNVRVASIGPKKSARLVSFLAGSGFPIQSTKRAAILRGSPSGLKISHLPQEAPFWRASSDRSVPWAPMSSERPIRSSLRVRCLFPEAGSANLIRVLDPFSPSASAISVTGMRQRRCRACRCGCWAMRISLRKAAAPTASARREFLLGLRPARSGKSYLFCSLDELSNPGS